MSKPQINVLADKDDEDKTVRYVLCCQLAGFLSYLGDAKVLSIDITMRERTVGTALLNFLVIKGWRGEMYEGFMNIVEGKKKIGEFTFSMGISKAKNPFLNKHSQ